MPRSPYIGKYISKHFEGCGMFLGQVVAYKRPYYKVIYEDGDQEELEVDEVQRFAHNGIVDKHAVTAIQRHTIGVATSSHRRECDAKERDEIIKEFHDAVMKRDISRISAILFDEQRYDKLLSPLHSRESIYSEELCEGVSYTSLHQDLTLAEKYIDEWRAQVARGDLIDIFKPNEAKWYLVRVEGVHRAESDGEMDSLKVHYMYWNKRYDEIITGLQLQTLRMSPPLTIASPHVSTMSKSGTSQDAAHTRHMSQGGKRCAVSNGRPPHGPYSDTYPSKRYCNSSLHVS